MKNKINISYKKNNIFNDKIRNFIIITVVSLLFVLCVNVIASLFFGKNFFWKMNPNTYVDFIDHIKATSHLSTIYQSADSYWRCFPPFSYLIYCILNLIAFPNNTYYEVYVVYLALEIIIFTIVMQKYNFKYKNIVLCMMILSWPFVHAIQSGNSALYVMIFLLLAVKLYYSNDDKNKELSMILIAICAGLKFYPAIFGLLFIFDKDYKRALRLVLYGILIVFIPFIFTGGINGMIALFNTLIATNNIAPSRMCLGGMIYIFISETCRVLNINFEYNSIVRIIIKLIQYLFLFINIYFAYRSKTIWQRLFFLVMIMIGFLNNSCAYTLIYLSIPLFLLFENKKIDNANPYLFAILFSNFLVFKVYNTMSGIMLYIIYFYNVYYLIKNDFCSIIRK